MSPRIVFIALPALVALTLPSRGDQPATQPARPGVGHAAPGIVPLGGPPHAPRPPATAPTTAPADDVEGKVFQIIATVLEMDKSKITRNTSITDVKLDELDRTEIIMSLEDTFKIEIPDAEALKLITVGQMIDYVNAHR